MLRAAGFDAFVLEHSLPSLQEHLALAMPIEPALRADVLGVLDGCWANYYSVGEPTDLARRVAMLLYRLGEFRRALTFFAHHRRLQGAVRASVPAARTPPAEAARPSRLRA